MPDLNAIIERTAPTLSAWWRHEDQDRPCIVAPVLQPAAAIAAPRDLQQHWTDVDFVTDRQMTIIDRTTWYGHAVPMHYIDFGASAMACALGATPEYVNEETIWAHPHLDRLEAVLEVDFDDENFCRRTVLATARASAARAAGHHVVGPYALGGIADTVAGLYGTENLLMDMAARPELVRQAMAHVTTLWLRAWAEIQAIIATTGNPGGIGWAGVWAPGTTFPIQEDFSYMISPDMFRAFCLEPIRAQVDAMDCAMYHLDGMGAIGHLDALLEIENLKVIQWVPGAGHERLDQWYDLLRRIIAAGKSVQVFAQADEIDALVAAVGPRGLLVSCPTATDDQAGRLVETYIA